MFNLEQSIAIWRRQMSAGGIKSHDVLDELESHLREDIERQIREGTQTEQAFARAVERVGRADELKLEFGKVERLRPATMPKLVRSACAAMAVSILLPGMFLLSDAPIAERISGFIWLMLASAYIAALPRLNRKTLPGVRGWALRRAFGIACSWFIIGSTALLLIGCTNLIHFPPIPNVLFWPLYAAAAATILVLAYGTDARSLGFSSPATQECLELANHEALRYHHDFVGTEHVLLGLLESKDSAVSKVLGNMGVSREAVRAEIEKIVVPQPQPQTGRAPVGTPRAKKAFTLGLLEAKAQRYERMDPPHLFLGLLREGGGVAAIVLNKLGVDLQRARAEILKNTK